MKCMATIANQLADAGHEVTYFQPVIEETHKKHELVKNSKIEIITYSNNKKNNKDIATNSVLSNSWISKDLADYLKVRAIISVFTGTRLNAIRNALGEPSTLHYLPIPSSHIGPYLTISDRFNDLWHKTFSTGNAMAQLFDLQYETVVRLTNGKVRHWKQILNDVTYHFTNTNPFLDFVVSTIPKVIPIGGYTMDYSEVLPVPGNLDKLLNSRPYTVFISYGSMVSSESMPEDYKIGMLKMFASNPNVTFLWKYEDPEDVFMTNNLPENVHIQKWFPQQSLLGDARVNLFITHGGLGSVMELAYAGKPAIVTPLFADQPGNAQMLSRHGSVEIYSKFDIADWEKQSVLLKRMLGNDSYQIAASRLAQILAHQPISPLESMVKHAEHAARFGKIPTLTPFAKDLNYIQFYNLDLIFCSIIFFLFLSYIVIQILRKVIQLITWKQKIE